MTGWDLTSVDLEQALSKFKLQPCLNSEMKSRGWLAPKDNQDSCVHLLGKQMLIAFGVEKKLLPSTVISQFSHAKAAEIEEIQGYKPARKQMKEIKELVTNELLPRAFALRNKTLVWIDPVDGWFVINTANTNKADEIIEMLYKSSVNFALKPIKTQLSPSTAMTNWLSEGDMPSNISIDQNCELKDLNQEKAAIRYVRHTPDSEEVIRHIKMGKVVARLSLTWNNRISFVLDESFQIKQVSALDFLKEQTETMDFEDTFDGDFSIMTGEFKKLIPDLIEALQGEIVI
jgi:recombination associated protein RdgC